MGTTLNGKGTVITALDATQPMTAQTAGEGRAARLLQVEDVVALDAVGLAAIGSYYRLCRVPANAKIKKVEVFTDAAPDTNAAQQLALDFGVIFSDSTIDGTPVAFQGLAPAVAKDGTVVAAGHANRNKLFGTITLAGNNAAIPLTEITHKGTIATLLALTQKGLAKIFAFVSGQGYDMNCPGYMDLYAYVATAAATGGACNLYARVSYSE